MMGELLRLLNAPCRDIAALISTAMDTELPRRQRWPVRLHLLYCTACRSYSRHIRFLRGALRLARELILTQSPGGSKEGVPSADVPALSAEARQRIQNSLDLL